MFLPRQDVRRRLGKGSESLYSIGVALLASSGIPHDGILDILGLTDTDFGVVAHGELGGRKTIFGGFLGKGEGEGLVLVETSTRDIGVWGTTQEPLAEGHIGLGLALLTGKTVVLDAEKRVKRKRGLCVFIGMTKLVLGRGKVKVGSTFEMLAGVEERVGCERGEKMLRDGCLCKLVEEDKGKGIGRLGHLQGCKTCCSLQKRNGCVQIHVEA